MAEFIRAIRFIRVIRGWVEKLGAIGISLSYLLCPPVKPDFKKEEMGEEERRNASKNGNALALDSKLCALCGLLLNVLDRGLRFDRSISKPRILQEDAESEGRSQEPGSGSRRRESLAVVLHVDRGLRPPVKLYRCKALHPSQTNRPCSIDDCHHAVREARRGDPAQLLRRSASNEHLQFVIAKEPKRLRQSPRPDGLPRSASLARNDNRGCSLAIPPNVGLVQLSQ